MREYNKRFASSIALSQSKRLRRACVCISHCFKKEECKWQNVKNGCHWKISTWLCETRFPFFLVIKLHYENPKVCVSVSYVSNFFLYTRIHPNMIQVHTQTHPCIHPSIQPTYVHTYTFTHTCKHKTGNKIWYKLMDHFMVIFFKPKRAMNYTRVGNVATPSGPTTTLLKRTNGQTDGWTGGRYNTLMPWLPQSYSAYVPNLKLIRIQM